jgi:hypothetical protein
MNLPMPCLSESGFFDLAGLNSVCLQPHTVPGRFLGYCESQQQQDAATQTTEEMIGNRNVKKG